MAYKKNHIDVIEDGARGKVETLPYTGGAPKAENYIRVGATEDIRKPDEGKTLNNFQQGGTFTNYGTNAPMLQSGTPYTPLQYGTIDEASPSYQKWLGATEKPDSWYQAYDGVQRLNEARHNFSWERSKQFGDELLNRKEFSYDMSKDTLWQNALSSAMASGKSAMASTMGQASALTGGYGSSYAVSAGAQAYNQYIKDIYDNIPEYYQMALQQYQMEGDEMMNKYNVARDLDTNEYNLLSDDYRAQLDIMGIENDDWKTTLDILGQQVNQELGFHNQSKAFEQGEGHMAKSVEESQRTEDNSNALKLWETALDMDYKDRALNETIRSNKEAERLNREKQADAQRNSDRDYALAVSAQRLNEKKYADSLISSAQTPEKSNYTTTQMDKIYSSASDTFAETGNLEDVYNELKATYKGLSDNEIEAILDDIVESNGLTMSADGSGYELPMSNRTFTKKGSTTNEKGVRVATYVDDYGRTYTYDELAQILDPETLKKVKKQSFQTK